MVHAAELPDTGICFESFYIIRNKIMQVNAGSFFFTFDNEFYIAWQFTIFRKDRIDGMQARCEVTFIIAHAATIHFAVANFRFKWRAIP
mgnify:CR=1 FL=1